MSTQKEAAGILEALVPKIGTIKDTVLKLEAAAADQDEASPELTQAVTDVKAAIQDLADTANPPVQQAPDQSSTDQSAQ